MEILNKVWLILSVVVLIYLWNTYIIPFIVKFVVRYHKRNKSSNLHRNPIKFFVENEAKIIKYLAGFYWFGAFIITVGILIR